MDLNCFTNLSCTVVAKNDYCDSIDIAGSTIAILLLLWITIVILLLICLFEGEN